MTLPPRDQIHQYLRFEGLEYKDADITDFEERLGRIYGREIHRVQVFDFGGLTDLMAEGLSGRMLMEHMDAQGQSVFTTRAWRRLFKIRGPLVHELILEFFSKFRFGEVVLDLDIAVALQFQLGGVRHRISSTRNFLGTAPSYTLIRDPMLRLCHRLIACSIAGRSQAPEKVIVTDLFYKRGWMLVQSTSLICWLASGPERQQVAAASAPEVAEGAPDVDEGDQAILEPVQVPQPPPIAGPARTWHRG
ncbi:hypothetical protein Tco_0457956 [Tanacetum coccineum]